MAGYFQVFNATDMTVEIRGLSGTDINLERDVNISRNAGSFLAAFDWRIASRSLITFSYYNINRSATHTLNKDIIFEDTTYSVNASVNTYFNTAIYHFTYGYAFLSKPKFELGLLIGAHIMSTKPGSPLPGTLELHQKVIISVSPRRSRIWESGEDMQSVTGLR